jgi:hypothetical protein
MAVLNSSGEGNTAFPYMDEHGRDEHGTDEHER